MELWFTEEHNENVRFSIRVQKALFSNRSNLKKLQEIDVLQTEIFGNVLVLDDSVVITEKDEFIYHEMMVHIPMMVNPAIKKVLVIGGANGGCLRELIKYDTIESIDLIEADQELLDVCKKYFPKLAKSFKDARVKLVLGDGLKFVRKKDDEYDLILVDSTDPFGPQESFFTREFYSHCSRALTEKGIMVTQQESPFYVHTAHAMHRAYARMTQLFKEVHLYQAHVPSYPAGYWLFGYASHCQHPLNGIDVDAWEALGIKTRYYNPQIHSGSFALPTYVKEDLDNDTLD